MANGKTAEKPTKAEIEARIKAAGERALAEAAERRAAEVPQERPKELGGQKGPEPTRYGDWEKKGIISDF
ncbi:MAG TPA: DUF1674 domain-containing protein [Rhizomicrobium sp.]|nr:DUF1674 domain-containing protein [Rhizomicrobium sp.]